MLIAAGNVDTNQILDSMINMAKDLTSTHELNEEKGNGSWTHEDGWGIAYLDQNNEWKIERSTKAIFRDPTVNNFRNLKTKLAIVHVRKKMGSEVSIHNTHPFQITKENPGSYVFCHNGFIDEEVNFDKSKFTLSGETDSEKLFYSILTNMKKDKIVKAIRKNFKRYKKLTGTNIILSTKKKSVIAIRKNNFPKYYQMHLGQKSGQMVISSEELPTLTDFMWEPLDQGDVIRVDNNNLDISIYKEKIPAWKKAWNHLRDPHRGFMELVDILK